MSAALGSASVDRFVRLGVEYLLDRRVGIVESVNEHVDSRGAPGIFQFSATGRGASGARIHAGGASTDRRVALAKCMGEIIERYCADSFDPNLAVHTSYRDADFPCLNPSWIAPYLPSQFREPGFPSQVVAFDELTKVGWVPARELGSSTTCWVPASKVFFPYDRALLGEVAVLQPFTTGLAAHALPSAAILGAICEVVERDAFSIVWQAKMSVPEIRLESLDDPNRALVERHVRSGRELRLFDMTLDHGIPSVLAVLRSASGAEPALVFAAATAPSPRVAVQKCLEEMQLMRVFADFLDTSRPRVRREAREVQTREDHVRFYCDHENTRLVEFLLGATEIRELDELPSLATGDTDRDLALVVERLRGMGHPVLVREFSAPELAELGLTVVRAIVAGFQPLAFGHAARALALPRLWTVPKRLGYPGIEPETGDNPAPHPFP